MEKHELRCTGNPNRVCGMCRMAGLTQKPVSVLAILVESDEQGEPCSEYDLGKLREGTQGCPACMLAALRKADVMSESFSWKTESNEWLKRYGIRHGESLFDLG